MLTPIFCSEHTGRGREVTTRRRVIRPSHTCTLQAELQFLCAWHTAKAELLTLRPITVGRSVSGELAVIFCAAITPCGGKEDRKEVWMKG